ncbi:MAG: hypothetical protein K0R13_1456 [Propionibacteriaceae bacterium]|nr:hypothetical protein [Propionibacteriaceae bacterium]
MKTEPVPKGNCCRHPTLCGMPALWETWVQPAVNGLTGLRQGRR